LIEQIVARLCRQSQHPLRIDVYQRSSPHDPRVQRALSLSSSSGPRGIEGRTNKMPVSATRLSTYPLLGFVRRTWSYPHQLIGHRRVLLLGRLASSALETTRWPASSTASASTRSRGHNHDTSSYHLVMAKQQQRYSIWGMCRPC
jgi:hypothetical protein